MKQIPMITAFACCLCSYGYAQVTHYDTGRNTKDFIKSPISQPVNPQKPANYQTSDMLNNSSYQNNNPQNNQPIQPNNGTYQGNGTYQDRTRDNATPPVNRNANNGIYTPH